MGQYYTPIFLDENDNPTGWVYSHDFASGLKLMEHSWMKNDFVGFVERHLLGRPTKLVWAGDYADEEPLEKLTASIITSAVNDGLEVDDIKERSLNLYSIASYSAPKITHNEKVKDKYNYKFNFAMPKRYKYLINWDKGEYVDKTKVPVSEITEWKGKEVEWIIHPLPLLTCEGNNRGGGDFRGDGKDLVGRWSRDKISVTSRKSTIPKGFKEVIFDLTE